MDSRQYLYAFATVALSVVYLLLLGAAAFAFHDPGLLALALAAAGVGAVGYFASSISATRAGIALSAVSLMFATMGFVAALSVALKATP